MGITHNDVLQYFQFLELFCSKSIYTHICMCGCKKMDLRKKKKINRESFSLVTLNCTRVFGVVENVIETLS